MLVLPERHSTQNMEGGCQSCDSQTSHSVPPREVDPGVFPKTHMPDSQPLVTSVGLAMMALVMEILGLSVLVAMVGWQLSFCSYGSQPCYKLPRKGSHSTGNGYPGLPTIGNVHFGGCGDCHPVALCGSHLPNHPSGMIPGPSTAALTIAFLSTQNLSASAIPKAVCGACSHMAWRLRLVWTLQLPGLLPFPFLILVWLMGGPDEYGRGLSTVSGAFCSGKPMVFCTWGQWLVPRALGSWTGLTSPVLGVRGSHMARRTGGFSTAQYMEFGFGHTAHMFGSQTPFQYIDGGVCPAALRSDNHLLFPSLVFNHGTGKFIYPGTMAMLLL